MTVDLTSLREGDEVTFRDGSLWRLVGPPLIDISIQTYPVTLTLVPSSQWYTANKDIRSSTYTYNGNFQIGGLHNFDIIATRSMEYSSGFSVNCNHGSYVISPVGNRIYCKHCQAIGWMEWGNPKWGP